MRAAILSGKQTIAVTEAPEPGPPGQGEVKMRVRAVGICGSDLKYYYSGGVSGAIERPFVLGHEAAGEIVGLGEGVHHLALGDRVAIEPGRPCWQCQFCRAGDYNLCPTLYFMGSRSRNGALQEFVNWPANLVFGLPDSLSYEEGTWVEPLSVALSGVRQAGIGPGSRVLVLGAGTIGLAALQLARLSGAVWTAITDAEAYRLEAAGQFQPDRTIDVGALPGQQPLLPDSSVDAVIDTTGAAGAIEQAFQAIKPGGRLILIGLSHDRLPLSLLQIVYQQLSVQGVYRYKDTFPAIIDFLAAGRLSVKALITHRFPLQDIELALQTAAQKDQAIKVVITL